MTGTVSGTTPSRVPPPAQRPHNFGSSPNSTPLGWRGWRVQPRCRWWEFPLAEGTCAGPTGEQYLQLAHDRKRGQADARAFGSSRSSVTKAWATDTKLT